MNIINKSIELTVGCWRLFSSLTMVLCIVFPHLNTCLICLPLLPQHIQDELPEEIIEKVKWSVNRDSAEDKVRDYLAWMKAVKREVIHVVSGWGMWVG